MDEKKVDLGGYKPRDWVACTKSPLKLLGASSKSSMRLLGGLFKILFESWLLRFSVTGPCWYTFAPDQRWMSYNNTVDIFIIAWICPSLIKLIWISKKLQIKIIWLSPGYHIQTCGSQQRTSHTGEQWKIFPPEPKAIISTT